MNKKKLNKIIKVCEGEGWDVYDTGEGLEISQASPAGEDFNFYVDKDNLTYNIINYACNFDPEEHAKMWIENMGNVAGVPQSIRILIDDADDIAEMLENLADKLRRLDNE